MPHVCYYVDISKFPLKSDMYSTNSDKIKSCLASFKRQGLAGLPVNTSQAVCVRQGFAWWRRKSHQLCRLALRTWIDRGRFQPRDVNFRQLVRGELAGPVDNSGGLLN